MNRLSITLLPSTSTVQGNAGQKGRTQDQYCPVGKLLATERQKVTVCTEASQLRGLPELARELTTAFPALQGKRSSHPYLWREGFLSRRTVRKNHTRECAGGGGCSSRCLSSPCLVQVVAKSATSMLFVEKYGRGTWRLRLAAEHRVAIALRAGSGGKGLSAPRSRGRGSG